MKQTMGWWFPDHEQHLIEWMRNPKTAVEINGRRAYQGSKQLVALQHCRQTRVAVDVGAHVGLWSFNLAHAFQFVAAFEPVAEHRDCFALNVPRDRAAVVLHSCALGAVEGSVKIAVAPGSSGDSRVAGDGDIPMKRLDSFKLTDVDLLKIDCEGYEENVVDGAHETIMLCRPVIVVEQKRDMANRFGLKPQGAVSLLKRWGYKVAEEISGDYIMVPA
jgi:FkbM family methyltransferase